MTEHIAKGPGQLSSPGPGEDGIELYKIREAHTLTEPMRRALQKEHSNDWSMETVAEAAYICAEAAAVHDRALLDAVLEAIGEDEGYQAYEHRGFLSEQSLEEASNNMKIVGRNALRAQLRTKIKAIWGIK